MLGNNMREVTSLEDEIVSYVVVSVCKIVLHVGVEMRNGHCWTYLDTIQ